ncbi:MAG: peroxiredoxin [Myxococcota bacterium]
MQRPCTWLVWASLAIGVPVSPGCGTAPPEALAVGARAPSLSATAHDGTTVDLGNLAGPSVVYFYPRDGTPGCTKEACAFRDVWSRYQSAGVLVVGVSADSLESHREFAEEHGLPFPLIADEDHTWSKAFGVDTTMGMTHRDSFLIGRDGTIAKVYPGVDPGVHADQVLADAAGL